MTTRDLLYCQAMAAALRAAAQVYDAAAEAAEAELLAAHGEAVHVEPPAPQDLADASDTAPWRQGAGYRREPGHA